MHERTGNAKLWAVLRDPGVKQTMPAPGMDRRTEGWPEENRGTTRAQGGTWLLLSGWGRLPRKVMLN